MTSKEKNYGWAGKILRVNLSNNQLSIDHTIKYASRFVGGRGVGQWILFNELGSSVHPKAPENLLIFSAGPLVGTLAPASCRISVESKNPVTGGTGYANAGGSFASELKYAGFDHVVISGRSLKPVYIWINDGNVEVKDASHLWTRTTSETTDIIRQEIGESKSGVASIGPAGENHVFASAIIVDKSRAAGGSSFGTVMGSKNLKAIAVRGEKAIEIADSDAFMKVVERAVSKINSSKYGEDQKKLGSHGRVTHVLNERSIIPVRNYQDDQWNIMKMEKIDIPALRKYERERVSCPGCPMGCGHSFELTDGPYAGTKCGGLQANFGYGIGARFDIDYGPALIKAKALCDELGLDIDNTVTILSWAYELFEHGILKKNDTDGYELKWGDHETLMKLIEKLAYREGFCNILADGFGIASERIGRGSDYYAMHVKGQGIIDSLRTAIAWGLGIVTSTRGSRHLDGSPTAELRGYSPDIGEKFFGIPTAGMLCTYEGKAELVFFFENLKAIVDSLGFCYFTSYWGSIELLGPDDYAELFSHATGIKKNGRELMFIGRQIHEVEKAFNTLNAGFTRKDDLPPPRAFAEAVKTGAFKGQLLDSDKYNRMLNDYYRIHGWNQNVGWQTSEGLRELDLPEVAAKLRNGNRLLE